jgi:hypothetical protein
LHPPGDPFTPVPTTEGDVRAAFQTAAFEKFMKNRAVQKRLFVQRCKA